MCIRDSDYVDHNDKSIALNIGNVLTIEPGIYISPSQTIPKEFWGIGIRIEDDVAVGEKNPQILSINAPKEVNELESIVGSFGE